jgi:hypothetical protein
MTEYWGWCGACERSFYVGAMAVDAAPDPDASPCPVCLEPPTELKAAATSA